MKLLWDFFPIACFFIAYKLGDIYIATGVAILASVIQVIWSRLQTGAFQTLPLFTFATVALLGGATIVFRNELFIKWKPTAIYWLLAIIFWISHFMGSKPILQKLAQNTIQLPDKIWIQLSNSWAVFFLILGSLNLYIVYHFDTNTWVNFKLFGTLALTFVFVLAQSFYLSKYLGAQK